MEKLTCLLKEYLDKYFPDASIPKDDLVLIDDWQWFYYWLKKYLYETIISKKFKFIKRLVKNNKIDLDIAREKLWIPCCVWYGSWRIIAVNDVEDYKQILMLLSISNKPIDNLIDLLK